MKVKLKGHRNNLDLVLTPESLAEQIALEEWQRNYYVGDESSTTTVELHKEQSDAG